MSGLATGTAVYFFVTAAAVVGGLVARKMPNFDKNNVE
jgi:hypothetical protein